MYRNNIMYWYRSDLNFSCKVAVSRKRNQVKALNGVTAVSFILDSDSTSTLVSRYQCLPTLECPFKWKLGAHASPQQESE